MDNDRIQAAKELMGERFPAEKYISWKQKFAEKAEMVQGDILYICGHRLTPQDGAFQKEFVKLSLSEGHCPKGLCPVCRDADFERVSARAAARERALQTLGDAWPEQ